jgi:hypothetical protein
MWYHFIDEIVAAITIEMMRGMYVTPLLN